MRRIIALALICGIVASDSQARIIANPSTANPQDTVCFGGRVAGNSVKSSTEVCIDANGNIVPTGNAASLNSSISNVQSLGTPSSPWGSVYFGTQAFVIPSSSIGTSPFVLNGLGITGNGGSCGSAVTAITGTDFAGILTLGTGSNSACTIGFSPVFVNTPICSIDLITSSASGNTSGIALNAIVLPTSIQFNTALGGSAATNKGYWPTIDWICVGQTQ